MNSESIDSTKSIFTSCNNRNCQSFRKLINSLNDAVLVWEINPDDTLGRCIETNIFAEKLLGYSREEFLSLTPANIYPEKESSRLSAGTKKLLEREELTFKASRKSKTGELIPVEVNAKLILLNDQRAVISISHDRRKTKRVTEKLWEANRTYRFLFDHNPLPIIIFGLDSKNILEVNSAAVAFYGYSKTEFKTLSIYDIRPSEEVPRTIEYLSRIKENAELEGKWVHQKKNGDVCNVEIIAQNIKFKGEPARYLLIQDISEKEKEDELIRQQVALVNNNPASVIQTNSEFKVTLINSKAEKIFERNIVGEFLYKLLPPLNEINLFNLFNRANNQFEFKIGSRYFIFTINWDPELSSFFIFGSDISTLKQYDEALKVEKAFFEELFQNAPEGIVIVDKDSFVMRANNKFTELFEYSEEEIMGINVETLIVSEEERASALELTKKAAAGEHVLVESNRVNKSGKQIPVSIAAAPIIVGGVQKAVLGIYRDVSERKEFMDALQFEKDLFHNLMDNIPDSIYFKDLDNRFVRINKSCSEKFGLKNAVDALGKNDFDFFSEPSAEEYLKEENKIIETGEPLINKESKEQYPDGKTKWAAITKMPFKNSSNEIIGTCAIARDITEKKESLEKLEKYTSELTKLNESKDKLLSIIAHDLKNPFNAIINLSRLLQDYYDDYSKTEQMSIITQIISASEKTYGLLSNLLDWARSKQGMVNVNKQLIDLNELIEIAAAPFEEFAKIKGISILKSINNCKAFIDRYMIQTVLTNLLNNAIKYTETGGEINIGCSRVKNSIEIRIADNGVGMTRKTIDRLFIFEETVSTPGTENERGTGLGLILCKEFVDKNDGRIEVESIPGKGTCFKIILPVNEESCLSS